MFLKTRIFKNEKCRIKNEKCRRKKTEELRIQNDEFRSEYGRRCEEGDEGQYGRPDHRVST